MCRQKQARRQSVVIYVERSHSYEVYSFINRSLTQVWKQANKQCEAGEHSRRICLENPREKGEKSAHVGRTRVYTLGNGVNLSNSVQSGTSDPSLSLEWMWIVDTGTLGHCRGVFSYTPLGPVAPPGRHQLSIVNHWLRGSQSPTAVQFQSISHCLLLTQSIGISRTFCAVLKL